VNLQKPNSIVDAIRVTCPTSSFAVTIQKVWPSYGSHICSNSCLVFLHAGHRVLLQAEVWCQCPRQIPSMAMLYVGPPKVRAGLDFAPPTWRRCEASRLSPRSARVIAIKV
jgi:hypothetical protein